MTARRGTDAARLAATARLRGRSVIASISGGKDSAALSLYLKELGIEHGRIFFDTGWEHPATYEYLRGELARVIGPVQELRSEKYPGGMPDLVVRRGMFPSRRQRFCTQELKVFPAIKYLAALADAGIDPVNAVGIRREESESRREAAEWEWSEGFDCEVWRPLVEWTVEDVIAIHRRHGLRPNPLYLRGVERVGCWPCILSRKAEIRMVADTDPARIDLIRGLEGGVAREAERRYAEQGETFTSRGLAEPTFFQAKTGITERPDGSKTHDGSCWPIDRVVEWSHTKRGGKEFEPFAADPGDQGCVRWGLCETGGWRVQP